MEDKLELEIVAKKSVKGVFALVSRTFLVQVLSIIASVVLTIFLDPASFGVFFVVSSIVIFLNYFQDIGLAASLIQMKEEPTVSDLRTTFTIQQILVLALIIPGFIFSGSIGQFYHLNSSGVILFNALLIAFFASSLKTIPTIMLERRLDFNKLVVPEIAENLIYNLCLIFFAVMGYGITSFTIAVLARSFLGLIIIYFIQPWSLGIAFDRKVLKKLLSFGLPFQTNSILALIKDDLLNLYIAKALPLAQVGYIGFSQKWAFMPLRLVMDNVIRITFPSYSRLQHDTKALRLAIEKSLFLVSSVIFPSAVGLIILSPYFIAFVPRYQKWEPALIALTFFALNTVFSSISTPLTNFLNAIGKVKITLNFMAFWTIAIWITTFFLIQKVGYNGVAIASFLVSLSSIAVIFVARKYVEFSIIKPVIRQFIAALIMGVFILFTKTVISNLPMLVVWIVVSGLFYCIILFVLAKDDLLKTLVFIKRTIRE